MSGLLPKMTLKLWPVSFLIVLLAFIGTDTGPTWAGRNEIRPQAYSWLRDLPVDSVASRIEPPNGFERIPTERGSFAAWLRGLPLRPSGSLVWLYNGQPKINQLAHNAVLEVDVGKRDLQQCADAVIRLRAEYLWTQGCHDAIAFHFTSGHLVTWQRWQDGDRPKVQGNQVSWNRTSPRDGSYENFRKYLDVVFNYAGTLSLSKELEPVGNPLNVQAGDVFIQGGSPGHAVLVVDVASNAGGERVFLLAQSYMPAQDIHILRNSGSKTSPWYPAKAGGALVTPEWSFRYEDLKRFPAFRCGNR